MSCECCNECCPEPADVTVNENTYVLDADAMLELTIPAGGATQKTVEIQIQDSDGNPVSGNFKIQVWFCDSDADLGAKSVIPPTVPGVSELEVVTDGSGYAELPVEWAGIPRSWELCMSITGVVYHDTLNLGV
jgi:hypothetical protein